jgi:hypothetical protein
MTSWMWLQILTWMWLQILTASPLEMLVDRCGTAVDKWLTGSAAKDYDRQQRHVEAWNFRHCLAGDRLQVSLPTVDSITDKIWVSRFFPADDESPIR